MALDIICEAKWGSKTYRVQGGSPRNFAVSDSFVTVKSLLVVCDSIDEVVGDGCCVT